MSDINQPPSDDSSNHERFIINTRALRTLQNKALSNNQPIVNTVVEGNVVSVYNDFDVDLPESGLRVIENEEVILSDTAVDSNTDVQLDCQLPDCGSDTDDPLQEIISTDQADELSRLYYAWHKRKQYQQDFISAIWRAFQLPGEAGQWSSLNVEQYCKVLELLNGN